MAHVDTPGERRDGRAADRDVAAEHRDIVSESRDAAADRRDTEAGERDGQAQRQDAALADRLEEVRRQLLTHTARAATADEADLDQAAINTLLDDVRANLGRRGAGRRAAATDRLASARDRLASHADRHQASQDRDDAERDRHQAEIERQQTEAADGDGADVPEAALTGMDVSSLQRRLARTVAESKQRIAVSKEYLTDARHHRQSDDEPV